VEGDIVEIEDDAESPLALRPVGISGGNGDKRSGALSEIATEDSRVAKVLNRSSSSDRQKVSSSRACIARRERRVTAERSKSRRRSGISWWRIRARMREVS